MEKTITTSTVCTFGETEPTIILITTRVTAIKMGGTKLVNIVEKIIPEIIW